MALTPSQKKAVQAVDKNVLVSAGAGTGKTRVLVERILHLLKTQKAAITELLVLTFTEKAANEIKTRISGSFRDLGLERPRQDLEKAAISTFHSFASRLLKEHPIEAGVDPDFRVIETEQAGLLKEEVMNETLAKLYQEQSEVFEILGVYGEEVVRKGIFKVFNAARHEGKNLRDFFEESRIKEKMACEKREETLPREAQALIAKLDEIDIEAWDRFLNNKKWDWKTFRDFKAWSELYKGKRKAGWKAWRARLEELASLRIDPLAALWKEKFEQVAIAFETAYDARKKEKGFLDFDDLQMKAVGLFGGEQPALQKLRERYQRAFKFILVDEFQDTNFLQMKFVELLSSGKNLFMVGDYKQSIYGFRGAEPEIFFEKDKLYGRGEEGERIVLAESFRSDPPVLDFSNRFFQTLWEEDAFPFEPLVASPSLSEAGGAAAKGAAVELLVTGLKEGEDMSYVRLREARGIAARIRELHDKEKIPYGDIAVLFQAMTLSGIYEDAFKSAEVPYFIVAGRGFYEQPEIQDMMSCLSCLERPWADIPLAATLRSPFFHITDGTLFWLSRHSKKDDDEAPLDHALKELDRIPEISPEQRAKLEGFRKLARDWEQLKDRIPLSELIDKILESTGYEISVLMDPKGVRRYANLKKLVAMVREYETFERMSVAVFLNILSRLKAQEVRESEAQVSFEKSVDAVRMMSVHAAKGLEFPVVFVADMGHQGSRSGSKTVIAHAADGYAMQIPDEADREMQETYFFRWVDDQIAGREEKERKRLFYVAVTRARSRLFLSGVHKKKKEEKESFREMKSWMDWAMAICEGMKIKMVLDPEGPTVKRGRAKDEFREKTGALIRELKWKQTPEAGSLEKTSGVPASRIIDLPVSAFVLFQKSPEEFWRTYQIGWTAPISAKRKLIDIGTAEENEWAGESSIFSDEDFSTADFGTAMHGFFERFDFSRGEQGIQSETLERIFGRFGQEAVSDARKIILDFLKQPVFQKLRRARQVKREIDFVLNERHGLIHGKIDILFEDEEGAWHILDYKTAAGDEEAARKSAYDLQLEIYALAAERILKLAFRSSIIYYLKNQKAVTLSFSQGPAAAFFDSLEKKICDMQKQVLDYSNERMAQECGLKDER
jgi:ATP-dependent helicase/nuclease subunit A